MKNNHSSERHSPPSSAYQQQQMQFTVLEYIEFSSAAEFQKFKNMPSITEDEILKVDWNDLLSRLTA